MACVRRFLRSVLMVAVASCMGCMTCQRKKKKVKSHCARQQPADDGVTVVEAIYLPLELQPALAIARKRDTDEDVRTQLRQDGLLKSETLRETANGSVAFYLSFDGNAYPSGKPRLLDPIDLKPQQDKIQADLNNRMSKATNLRKEQLASVTRKARIASARQRQVVLKKAEGEESKRRETRERLERKLEKASRNRQARQQGAM